MMWRSFLLLFAFSFSCWVYAFIHEWKNGWVWKKKLVFSTLPLRCFLYRMSEKERDFFFFGNDMKSLFPSQNFLLFSQFLPFGVCHFNTFVRNEIFLHSHLCRLLVNILHNNTYFHTICLFHILKGGLNWEWF